MITLRQIPITAILTALAAPASAQQRPVHIWADVDAAMTRPRQDAQSFSATLPIFSEQATGSITYPTLSTKRTTAFTVGALVFHGLGAGARFSSSVRRQPIATVSLSLPDPVFFNRFTTSTTQTPLDRSDKTFDVSVVYAIPLGIRFVGARVMAGRSRVEIGEGIVQRFTFSLTPPRTIDSVTTQSVRAFAWGSHIGVDAEFFPLHNVGIGASIIERWVDIADQIDPFSGKPMTLTADRLVTSLGVRLRF